MIVNPTASRIVRPRWEGRERGLQSNRLLAPVSANAMEGGLEEAPITQRGRHAKSATYSSPSPSLALALSLSRIQCDATVPKDNIPDSRSISRSALVILLAPN